LKSELIVEHGVDRSFQRSQRFARARSFGKFDRQSVASTLAIIRLSGAFSQAAQPLKGRVFRDVATISPKPVFYVLASNCCERFSLLFRY
jgi:hypothetical protein